MAPARISPAAPGGEVIPQKPLRRPTLVRKYAEANLGEDQDFQTPASPTKRARVAFNNEVEINLVEDWDKAAELTREEVRRALERHRNGDDTAYDKIKQIFTNSHSPEEIPSPATVKNYTNALLSNASLIGQSCPDLVDLVLKSDWLRRDDAYVVIYQRLLNVLVLSQGMRLSSVLETLVENFLRIPIATSATLGLPPVSPRQIRSRVHNTLQNLLQVMPMASHALGVIIDNKFPYMAESQHTHIRYVHNLLHVADYAPELRSRILELITKRIVEIDVRVQVDIEDLDDDAGEDIVQAISKSREDLMDDSDDDSSDEDSDEDEEAAESDEKRTKQISENIQKLDILLDITFECYTGLFAKPATHGQGLDTLISNFNSSILATYRSRHTQFLIFHFMQTSPELIDIFVGDLLQTIFIKPGPELVKQTAAAYLGSFVARGNHVSADIVQTVFEYISQELSNIRSRYIQNYRGPDPRLYSTYYALCQALLYIFCFRWRDLREPKNENRTPSPTTMLYADEADELDEQPIFLPVVKETFDLHCFKSLNPLKVCSPSIVNEFAGIAYRLGVVYVYPLLEQNRRIRIVNATRLDARETALSNRRGDEWQGLDEYFPFDPYKLPRSKKWLEGDYREWQPIPGMDTGEADGDSDSEGEEDESGTEETGTEVDA